MAKSNSISDYWSRLRSSLKSLGFDGGNPRRPLHSRQNTNPATPFVTLVGHSTRLLRNSGSLDEGDIAVDAAGNLYALAGRRRAISTQSYLPVKRRKSVAQASRARRWVV